MSEYRNANDPRGRDSPYDINARGGSAAWGWAAGAVFLIVILALAFGSSHLAKQPGTDTMADNIAAAHGQPAPALKGPAGTAFTPTPMNPVNPMPANPGSPQSKP